MKKIFFPFLIIWMFVGCSPSEKADTEASTEKPNIIFLFADDQTYTSIQALGNQEINTPNLDRLVDNGVTFLNTYNMGGWHGAVCVASRTMMNSGITLWRSREAENKWRAGDAAALDQTWSRLMSANGYNTYMSGKWHIAAPADSIFHQARHIRPGMPGDTWPAFRQGAGKDLKEVLGTDLDLKEIMPVGYHRPNDPDDNSWSPADTSFGGFWEGGQHWSEVLRDDALDFIKDASQKEEPFFMYLAFNAPHDPRQAPQSFVDQYPLENISVPESFLPEYPWENEIGCSPGLRDEALAPFPRTEFAVKTHIQEYYAIITHMDEQIGKILEALEQSGEMDNTYIFFSADHGLSVGRHGLLGKQNLFDHSIRVPLMLTGPGIQKGKKIAADVYLQDIMATSLDLAGIEKPEYVEFNSFRDLATGQTDQGGYDEIYGAYIDLQRMIRKDGFKLIVYPKISKVLLFDLEKDPEEMHDLAGDPDYAEKVQTLLTDLIALQQQMGDKLDLNETL